MLYPRRLVFVDADETARMHAPTQPACRTDVSADGRASSAATLDPDIPVQGDKTAHVVPREEGEEPEDEDEEGEYDEEGEIADPVAPATGDTGIPASAGLDEIVARLGLETSRSVEQSLATVKETMARFQVELRVEEEEEEARRKARIAKEAAAESAKSAKAAAGSNTTRKRQRSITKGSAPSKARRKLDVASVSASSTQDVKQEVSNDDIPLQALMAMTTPPEGASTAAAAAPVPASIGLAPGGVSDSADADIDALFGGVDGSGLVETAGAEGGDGVSRDQGGIGLGFAPMGDDLGIGMGIGMGMGDGLDAGMGDFASNIFGVTEDDFNFFDSIPAQQIKADATVAAPQAVTVAAAMGSADADSKLDGMFQEAPGMGATTRADQATHSVGDDPFDDDGMFDSFFGGPSASLDGGSAAIKADVSAAEPMPNGGVLAAPSLLHDGSLSVSTSAMPPATQLERPDHAHMISSPPGVASVLSTTETHVGSAEPMLSSAMDVDLATPVSIKATPGHCADILTPTPTPSGAHIAKTPGAHTNAATGMLAETHQEHAPLGVQLPLNGLAPAGVPNSNIGRAAAKAALATPRKSSAHSLSNTTITPKPYSSISTPFDDIGASSRSWLRDGPTPMQVDDSDDPGMRALVPQGIHAMSLIEKSLNPVAWVNRVATRRLQHQARMRQRAASSAAGAGSGISLSARRLQGWLTTYRAKLSYTGDFVPHAARAESAIGASTRAMSPSSQRGAAGGSGVMGQASMPANLQYPPVGEHPRDRIADSRLPSFMSIINSGT
ncbi:hypothetical protein LPJ61_005554, partial [Coemansia biformis]